MDTWSDNYRTLTERNIGRVSEEKQERLRTSCVAVPGVGGIGGVCCELLARSGVGRLKIADNDRFEASNRNRQIGATVTTLGRPKTKAMAERLRAINPELEVSCFGRVDEESVDAILDGADVVALGIDGLRGVIALARRAYQRGIPLVESYAAHFAGVHCYRAGATPTYERSWRLPTEGVPLEQINEALLARARRRLHGEIVAIDTALKYGFVPPRVAEQTFARVLAGELPPRSFAPFVWLPSVLLATEVLKILLGAGQVAPAEGFFFDPWGFRLLPRRPGLLHRVNRHARRLLSALGARRQDTGMHGQ
jgi:molybdopterin/thiamine biosynthesis adenylyltransferase